MAFTFASIEASILEPSGPRWTPYLLLRAALGSADAQREAVDGYGCSWAEFYDRVLAFEFSPPAKHPWSRAETILGRFSVPHQWAIVLKVCSDIFQRDCRSAWACVAKPTAYAASLARVVLARLPADLVRERVMPHFYALPQPPRDHPVVCLLLSRGLLTHRHIPWSYHDLFTISAETVAHVWRATRTSARSVLQYVLQHDFYASDLGHPRVGVEDWWILNTSAWATSPHKIVRDFYDEVTRAYAGSGTKLAFTDEFVTAWATIRPHKPLCHCWEPAKEIIPKEIGLEAWVCEKRNDSEEEGDNDDNDEDGEDDDDDDENEDDDDENEDDDDENEDDDDENEDDDDENEDDDDENEDDDDENEDDDEDDDDDENNEGGGSCDFMQGERAWPLFSELF